MDSGIRDRFEKFLSQRGLRHTHQRFHILEAAFQSREFFDAEELWEKALRIDPHVSRSTLYRTVGLLLDCNLIREIDLEQDRAVYIANFDKSADLFYFVCTECCEVTEFHDGVLADRINSLTEANGLHRKSATVRVETTCDRSCESPEDRDSSVSPEQSRAKVQKA